MRGYDFKSNFLQKQLDFFRFTSSQTITKHTSSQLFKPSISIVSYDNTTVLNAVMEILSRNIFTRQASSFYKFPYRTILNVTASLESIQEQKVTPTVKNDNQQHIYR